jgi:hypothetical protein
LCNGAGETLAPKREKERQGGGAERKRGRGRGRGRYGEREREKERERERETHLCILEEGGVVLIIIRKRCVWHGLFGETLLTTHVAILA